MESHRPHGSTRPRDAGAGRCCGSLGSPAFFALIAAWLWFRVWKTDAQHNGILVAAIVMTALAVFVASLGIVIAIRIARDPIAAERIREVTHYRARGSGSV